MNSRFLAAGIAAFLCVAVHTPPADAAMVQFIDMQQGSGACQPAREYPDLRMRQKEVDNIGTTNAYVVCSPIVHFIGGFPVLVSIHLVNNSEVVRTFRCTLQNDHLDSDNSIPNVVREITVEPGAGGTIAYGDADFSNPEVQMPGIQCILPPSTSLAYMLMSYSEQDADT